MKYGVAFLLFQLCALILPGQKYDGIKPIQEAGETIASFEKIAYYKKQTMPFREIILLDKRFDSSKSGYANVLFNKSHYSRIILRNSWSTILNNYFRNNLDSTSTETLVIIIRSFWLQKGVLDELLHKKIVKKPIFGSTDYGGHCTAGLDVFVQSGSILRPLFKIDTSFINLAYNYNKTRIEEFFFLPFDSIARRIAITNVAEDGLKKRKLSWEEVNDYYVKRFELPVLKDPTIKKGIFRNFNEFRQNKPFETDFKFKRGRLTDELYAINNGMEDLVTDYWGFFDGNNLYIRAGFNAFKAIRQQNSFELFGAKHISNYHNNPSQGDIKLISYGMDEMIMQVNMENGNIY